MSAPLIPIVIPSPYKKRDGSAAVLPTRLARCTPDTQRALHELGLQVQARGGALRLSDLFRSYDMQFQAHLDYRTGKKSAFSPPPGGSLHEGGRAFDVDLGALKMPLAEFWQVAAAFGIVPIIRTPDSRAKESWHFECRGSHALVRTYYEQGKAANMKPYEALAASSIMSIGQRVGRIKDPLAGAIQSALIRLGCNIGNLDGDIGPKSRAAIASLDLAAATPAETLAALEVKLQAAFPHEWNLTPHPASIVAATDDDDCFHGDTPDERDEA